MALFATLTVGERVLAYQDGGYLPKFFAFSDSIEDELTLNTRCVQLRNNEIDLFLSVDLQQLGGRNRGNGCGAQLLIEHRHLPLFDNGQDLHFSIGQRQHDL